VSTQLGTRTIAGRYTVEGTLGQGAVGNVYRVRDRRSDAPIALKRVRAEGDRGARHRALLAREFHTLVQLQHPRIIEVYDYGLDDEGPYYTMELLDGDDMRSRGRIGWRDACALLCDVASSLAILHSRGLIHRDVSARNVRSTAEGRAKLIDFGAMMPMGLAKDVVGTPPFIAPEALQLQVLDARVDLFALGALGYFMLTGRNAYPARKLAELRDVWRTSPVPPNRIARDAPEALSRIIMQLLALDRGARPDTAAEVMQRLSAIADLPLDDHAAVSRSYLSTPAMFGRERQLLVMRRRVLALARSEGGTIMIDGAPGNGRSRLLDACVLEAKLVGATVVRAGASDAVAGELGVARALAEQLAQAFPERAAALGRLHADVLGAVVSSLDVNPRPVALPVGPLGTSMPPSAETLPDRGRLLRELRDFVVELARGQRVLIAVDDVEQIDAFSATWLAALAHKVSKHAIIIAVSVSKDADFTGLTHLKVLRDAATCVSAEPLDAAQTEALLRSVFGDVTNVRIVAARIFALAQGSPRTTMELSQHLVDEKLARYSGGAWSLPDTLEGVELPRDLLASLVARLGALGHDSLVLAEALAVSESDPITLDDYATISGLPSPGIVFQALDELVARRVLVAEGERYRLAQQGYVEALLCGIPEARARAVHSRLGDLLLSRSLRPLRVAHHFMRAGREVEAITILTALDLPNEAFDLGLIEDALGAAQRLELAPLKARLLRDALLARAPTRGAIDVFRRHVGTALELLDRECGLRDYRALSHLPDAERLGTALASAQARYDATPANERGLPPIDAIRELARYSANCCSVALQTFDLASLENLPDFSPLVPLSPALGVMSQLVRASCESLAGRTLSARSMYQAMLARMAEPDHGGFDEGYYRGVRLAIHYLLGLVEASMAMPSAETHAAICEADPEHRVNAWRIRVSLNLNRGYADEARKCQRRAELLQLQEPVAQRYLGTSAGFEMLANVVSGDLLGVKRSTDAVGELARRFVGWQPLHALGLAHYRALQGDLQGALEALRPAHALAVAGRNPYYPHIAAAQIMWLSDLGEHELAVSVGREHVAVCERLQLVSTDRYVYQAYAIAIARFGEHAAAVALCERVIATSEALGTSGLLIGALYEARARVAIACDDEVAFEAAAERCALEYKKGGSPALAARLARLLDEARKVEVLRSEPPPSANAAIEQTNSATEHHTVQSLMFECADDRDRARCALTLLLNGSTSRAAHLYGIRENGLELLASLPETGEDGAMLGWIGMCLRAEIDSSDITETATAANGTEREEHGPGRYVDGHGQVFEPIFLEQRDESGVLIVAVLALHVPFSLRTVPPKDLLVQIADQMIEHGDVIGVRV
jgi:hypothetical protein